MTQDQRARETAEDKHSSDEMAARCAEAMWANDSASKALGMTIEHVATGEARLSMTVRADMTNGHGTCHGGYIFTLADSALAFACNSYNHYAVAQHCSITFIAPATENDHLVAAAVEQTRFGRNGIYDVTVVRAADNAQIARFRGHSRVVRGTWVGEDVLGTGDSDDETRPKHSQTVGKDNSERVNKPSGAALTGARKP